MGGKVIMVPNVGANGIGFANIRVRPQDIIEIIKFVYIIYINEDRAKAQLQTFAHLS
jgi:hypothetical protein